MALRRYSRTSIIKGGKQYATSDTILSIRNAVDNNEISFVTRVLRDNERLDIIAGQVYGDSTLYWVIAAASGIAWPLQCPPGTVLKIPDNISQIVKLVG